jgi:hypothetical protein
MQCRKISSRDREGNVRAAAMMAVVVLALVPILTGCGSGDTAKPAAPKTTNAPTASPTIQDIEDLPEFAPLKPGSYFIDPDGDPSTPLRVVYEIPVEGWVQWIGAFRPREETDGHVGVSIMTVTNLVRDGCRDHRPADPPVGPSVDELAAALADLAPFKLTSPPRDVTAFGYRGQQLELTVPDLSHEGRGSESGFTECLDGNLKSWIAPTTGAFYGYTGRGYSEEFWILDVEDTRLVITAERTPGSPPEDLAELRAILDSIRIEP